MLHAPVNLVENFLVDPIFGSYRYDLPREGDYLKCTYTHKGRIPSDAGWVVNEYPEFDKGREYEVVEQDTYNKNVKLKERIRGNSYWMNWKKEGCNFQLISTEQQRAVARLNAAHIKAMEDMKKAEEERLRKETEDRKKREQETLQEFLKIQKEHQEQQDKIRKEAEDKERAIAEKIEKMAADAENERKAQEARAAEKEEQMKKAIAEEMKKARADAEEQQRIQEKYAAEQAKTVAALMAKSKEDAEKRKELQERYEAEQKELRKRMEEQSMRAEEQKLEMIRRHEEQEERARKNAIKMEMNYLLQQFQSYKKNLSMLQAAVFVLNRGSDPNQVKEIELMGGVDLLEILQENSIEELKKAWMRKDQLLMEWYYPKPPAYRFAGINWDDFNIVICGSSGSGKSSIVQAILRACGVPEDVVRSVEVGEKETTVEECGFLLANRIMLWDMPGGGTEMFQEGDEGELYIRSQYLAHFDLVLCVSATRMRTCEIYAYQKLNNLGRNVVWIRSKVDQDVKNREESLMNAGRWEEAEHAESQIIEQARKECAEKGIQQRSNLFLVGRKMNRQKRRFDMLFDFYNLLERIKLSGIDKIGSEDLLKYDEPESKEGEEEVLAADDEYRHNRGGHQPGMNGGGKREYQPEGRHTTSLVPKRKKGFALDASMLQKGRKGLAKATQVESGSTKASTDEFLASLFSAIEASKTKMAFDVDAFEKKMQQKSKNFNGRRGPEIQRKSTFDVDAFEKKLQDKTSADQDLLNQTQLKRNISIENLERSKERNRRKSVQQTDFRHLLKKRRQHKDPVE